MKDIFSIKGLHKSPLTTFVGILVLIWTFYHHQPGGWIDSGIGLGIGLGLLFLHPKKPSKDAACMLLLLLLSCGTKTPYVTELPQAQRISPADTAEPVRIRRPRWSLLEINVYKDKSTTVHQTGDNNNAGKKAEAKSVEGDGNLFAEGQVKDSQQDKSKVKDQVAIEGNEGPVHVGKQKEASGTSFSMWGWIIVLLGLLVLVVRLVWKKRKLLGVPF